MALSPLITRQLPITAWHNAHRLKLKGESMRKTHASLTDDEHLV